MHLLAVRLMLPAALLMGSSVSGQQTTGTLQMKISDPDGAPVPASGELRGVNHPRTVLFSADAAGTARVDSLPWGTYRLTLTMPGFADQQATVVMNSTDTVERLFTLQLAPVTTSLQVSILPDSLEGVPGSTSRLEPEDIEAMRPFSIKEAMRTLPGVHVVDEDAFGLNLNIGLRGLDPRRTQRTLLLEDGFPVLLGPYSDPSAHYHTPMELIERVELIKGSGQIVHGPQTVGGVLNLLTESPPDRLRFSAGAVLGNRSFRSAMAKAGWGGSRGGILGHVLHREGDGVREKHGHAVTHMGARGFLRLASNQSLMLQTSYYQEDSRISEAGINQDRYDVNPFSNPFNHDKFELQRFTARAQYTIGSEEVRLSTSLYYQSIDRTSWRQTDDSTDEMTANTATGCVGAARTDYDRFADLCGNKMRPRNYDFWGVEPRLKIRRRFLGMVSETDVGVRLHRESVRRRRLNGLLPDAREETQGTRLRDWNKIEVTAVPVYAQSSFLAGSWSFTPGIRVEHFRTRNRARTFQFAPVDVQLQRTQTVALPGFGATYFGLPRTTIFAGVHKGFAPPRPDESLNPTDPDFSPVSAERSTNYETGVRSRPLTGFLMEFALFRIDFRNQIVPGEAAGRPELTWANGGRTLNEGYETGIRLDSGPLTGSLHNVWVSAAYTHLFRARFNSDEFNGPVNVRDNRVPYAPRHLFSPGIGYEHPRGFQVRAGVEYFSEQFTDNLNTRELDPDGMSGTIPAVTILQASANFPLPYRGVVLFVSGSNLTDRRYLISRVDGIHVARPRQVFGGLRWDF